LFLSKLLTASTLEEFDSNDLPENKLWQVLKRIKENKVASIFRFLGQTL
jgi:hypothetical protein